MTVGNGIKWFFKDVQLDKEFSEADVVVQSLMERRNANRPEMILAQKPRSKRLCNTPKQ